MAEQFLPKAIRPLKNLRRLFLPVLLALAVGASMWFASPTHALQIQYGTLPSSGTLGSTFTFSVAITIEDDELLPLQRVDVIIYYVANPTTYKATLYNLPLQDTAATVFTPTEGSASGSALVSADAADNWDSYLGSGYAYWNNTGYTFTPGAAYGYGYQGAGPTSITYTVVWSVPASFPAGQYRVDHR